MNKIKRFILYIILVMEVKVLNIKQITKDFVKQKLSESDKLSKIQINDYLDILSAINKEQFVYNIDTPNGEYLLYITSKPSHINFYKNNKNE